MEKSKAMCYRCRDNYYNAPGNSTTGECWSFRSAKVVTRTHVGVWEPPPYEWMPEKVLSCHRPDGYVWLRREDVRITAKKAKPAHA